MSKFKPGDEAYHRITEQRMVVLADAMVVLSDEQEDSGVTTYNVAWGPSPEERNYVMHEMEMLTLEELQEQRRKRYENAMQPSVNLGGYIYP